MPKGGRDRHVAAALGRRNATETFFASVIVYKFDRNQIGFGMFPVYHNDDKRSYCKPVAPTYVAKYS